MNELLASHFKELSDHGFKHEINQVADQWTATFHFFKYDYGMNHLGSSDDVYHCSTHALNATCSNHQHIPVCSVCSICHDHFNVFANIKTLMEALLGQAAGETYETFRKLINEVHSISLKLFCSFSDVLIG